MNCSDVISDSLKKSIANQLTRLFFFFFSFSFFYWSALSRDKSEQVQPEQIIQINNFKKSSKSAPLLRQKWPEDRRRRRTTLWHLFPTERGSGRSEVKLPGKTVEPTHTCSIYLYVCVCVGEEMLSLGSLLTQWLVSVTKKSRKKKSACLSVCLVGCCLALSSLFRQGVTCQHVPQRTLVTPKHNIWSTHMPSPNPLPTSWPLTRPAAAC